MILALFVASILGNIIEKHSLMISNFLLFSIKDIKQQSTNVARIMGRTNFLYKNTKKILEFREHFQRKTSFVFKTTKLQGYCQLLALL
jgi:chorismate-pyruvate lyase